MAKRVVTALNWGGGGRGRRPSYRGTYLVVDTIRVYEFHMSIRNSLIALDDLS